MAAGAVVGSGRWSLAVLGAAVLTALVVSFAPLVSTETCHESSSPSQVGGCTSGSTSLAADEGAGILAVALVPAAVAAIPVLRTSKWTVRGAAIVLTLLIFAAGSIGLFVIPTAVVAWIADAATATGRN